MTRWVCAFCGPTESKRTKEHLWPTSLYRRVVALLDGGEQKFWVASLDKALPNEPTIRDVCAVCNNGELSTLDNYVCQVFDRDFSVIRERGEKVELEFDYHLLKRWLLKMSYNSARINGSDVPVFQPVLPYIMGQGLSAGRNVKLFLEMTYPSEIPLEHTQAGMPTTVRPVANRVGFAGYETPTGMKLVRAVHLRSFSFLLAFLPTTASAGSSRAFVEEFLSCRPAARELRASMSRVALHCDGIDCWTSLKSGMTHRLRRK
ncbi:hypothetical protein CO657_11175 [Rhizobium acidisoli]|uniref:Uncharacterized protein n=1 Tax=Rhizobium acidisoli TaxID=1538158 RepID=A0AAE5TVL5_9HYPH|nr:hypothetical protein [Rhizobium acidisoli]KPH05030.1 hypothetical protein AOG23_30035 [Rhizobium acidisoli]QAS78594.1 hypothetical protein CO657_11175 [Rhizobium acidisoli]